MTVFYLVLCKNYRLDLTPLRIGTISNFLKNNMNTCKDFTRYFEYIGSNVQVLSSLIKVVTFHDNSLYIFIINLE